MRTSRIKGVIKLTSVLTGVPSVQVHMDSHSRPAFALQVAYSLTFTQRLSEAKIGPDGACSIRTRSCVEAKVDQPELEGQKERRERESTEHDRMCSVDEIFFSFFPPLCRLQGNSEAAESRPRFPRLVHTKHTGKHAHTQSGGSDRLC